MDAQLGTDGNTQPTTVAAAVRQLVGEILIVTALSSSVRGIAQDLPATVLEEEDTICPEVIFPTLASEIIQRCNASLTLIERLEQMLREQGVPAD